MTQIEATSVSGTGSVHVQKFALVNNQNFDELTGLIFTEDDALKSKVTHANRAFSGTNQYNISYNNGVFSLIRNGYNPAVQTASVVNSALQTMQTSATNELFSSIGNHFSSNDSNLYASINDEQIFANTQKSNAGVWIRPYYGKEDLKLQDMPKVKSTIYGALIGVDSDLIELGNSFDVGFSVFAGYNGGEQKYDDVKARQNGVVIGAMASFYSGDFFSAFALNGGTIKSKITTSADINGDGSFNSYSFGIANKTGYNFNFANALTLQPSLTLMYSHIKSKDYTNASSVNISSDAVNAFQIAPTLKLIKGFENEFKAYVSAGGVFNTNNKTDVRADGVVLPGSAVKSYGEYTLGVEKRWDRFGGFIQAGYRSGDRKGAIGQFGFKWFFDQKTNSVHKIATVNGKKEVTF